MATAQTPKPDEDLSQALAQLQRAFELLKPFIDAVNKAMEDFGEAVRRDPQLARLIEEHARIQGLDRG